MKAGRNGGHGEAGLPRDAICEGHERDYGGSGGVSDG